MKRILTVSSLVILILICSLFFSCNSENKEESADFVLAFHSWAVKADGESAIRNL